MKPALLTLFLLLLFRPAAAQTYTVTDLGAGTALKPSSTIKKMCLMFCVGKMTDVASLYGTDAINLYHCDLFTGYASVASDEQHAFLAQHGKVTDLDASSQAQSQPLDVNAVGQVTGLSFPFSNILPFPHSRRHFHAFLYGSGKMLDLGALPGDEDSEGAAINDSGAVVGFSRHNRDNPDGTASLSHAFLYQKGRMQDLNSLVPPHSGWILGTAQGINNQGEIRGWGLYRGEQRIFLLTPMSQNPKP